MTIFSRLCLIVLMLSFSCEQASCKVLKVKQMGYISIGIWWMPSFMVNAWKARNLAVTTSDTIKKTPDEALVKTLREPLVKSLDNFLWIARMAKATVLPTLKESLGEESILWRLFNSSVSSKKFFAQEVQDIKSLTQLEKEIINYFQDLEDSLSPRSRRAYEKARDKQVKAAH